MMLILLTLAFGCVLASATLLYLMWVARTRRAEFTRLMTFLSIELEVAPATSGVLVSAHALVPQWLIRKFRQAGWMLNGRALVFVLLGYMAAVTLTIWRFGFLGGALAALAVGLIAITVLEWQAQAGMRHLSDSMLGFLERVRQLITVGNSLPAALERAVANSPPVVVNALTPTVRRIRNGSGVAESLERCALDLEVYELNLLATAARTNMRFGGSMTQILRNMIENIRKRTAVERELRADTTQVRASAWVLALLPVLVAAVIMLTNRSYSRWFLATESGHHMIAYAIVSQFIGVVLMRMITRVRY